VRSSVATDYTRALDHIPKLKVQDLPILDFFLNALRFAFRSFQFLLAGTFDISAVPTSVFSHTIPSLTIVLIIS